MSKKDEKLDKILKNLEELTQIIIDDLDSMQMENDMDWEEEEPDDAIQAFRLTEQVVMAMRKEFGEDWMDQMGIT
tara:strand:- start:299 stop:523 length:225 start_codon:yes stop_codon:yes gene_type:complete